MKHLKNEKLKKRLAYFLLTFAVVITGVFGVGNLLADQGDTPEHNKRISENGDGTYQLALDVTGDADLEVESASNVNVIIVYDVSQSMSTNVPGSRNSRGDQAEDVVHDFIADLAEYQNSSNPENIQMALVTFSVTANTESGWTSNLDTIIGNFDDGGTDGSTHFRYNGYGTNWDAALSRANTLLDSADDDPTFVILVTDGAPTASGNGNNAISPSGATLSQLRPFYAAALPTAKTIQGKDNTTLYGIYIYGNEADLLDDLMYNSFKADGEERTIGTDTVEAPNYFNAANTSALQDAIDEIFDQVVQAMGISSVSMSDGTTSAVKASSGTVNLLKVDESSYKYWLSMGVKLENGTYVNDETGNRITFTENSDGTYTGRWTNDDGSYEITGTIETDPNDEYGRKQIFKMQWTGSNSLEDSAPPAAQLVADEEGNESVDWDLSSVGVLVNGVTYTVTFDVWPTQFTYDLIADLENGVVEYSDLVSGDYAGLDEYITEVNGKYFLETNTKAMLKYKDTREDDPDFNYSEYTNPPSKEVDVDKIDINKKWENKYDGATSNPIDIIVNRDTNGVKDEFYRATLNSLNDFTVKNVNIATGLMRLDRETGKVDILEKGHDYSFEEENGQHYKWEFVAQTVHPMLINGELKELILLDEAATNTYVNDTSTLETYSIPEDMDEDDDYYDDGTYEYVRIDGKIYVITNATPTIKAFNYRRSNLNVNKVVDGDAADPEKLFEFKITVDDPGLYEDESLWFSIFDENDTVIIDENLPIEGDWTPEIRDGAPTGFYYGANGTELTVKLKVGQNLRFTNLTTQATYTIIETGEENYVFTSAEGTAEYGSAHTPFDYTEYEVDTDNNTITGDITMTNSTFNIEVKNTYELASIDLTKKWDDADDQDGKRPSDIEIQVYRQVGENGTPSAFGDPITIDESNATDDNTWEYTIESVMDGDEELVLPRYDADGNEYLYTVRETAIDDYTTTYNPEDVNQTDGKATYTITNKHVPELYNKNGKLKVTKIWDDFDNEDGLREEVTIELYINGEASGKTITLSTEQNSNDEFTDLPMYNDGVEIEYTIVETTELNGYDAPDYDMDTPGDFTVTNKHVPLYNKDGKLKVTKIWDDVQNIDELRENVTIELYINGEASGKTVELTTADTSSDLFTNLPKYDEDGVEIEYTIVETTELTDYEAPDYDMDTPGDFTVTNVHIPLYHEDGVLEVTKIWDDYDNEAQLRENVTIELYIDGVASGKTITLSTEQNSSDKFTDLPKYHEDGTEIEYTIVETTELTDYEDPDYNMDTPGAFTVTNVYNPLYNKDGKLKVTKIWNDFSNEDNLRQNVTIELYINGEASGKTVELTTADTSSDLFTNLPKYDENGTEIEYTIVETTELDGYEDPDYDMDTPGDFTVTNKHMPLYNKDGVLKVTKIWDDNDNYDDLREEVTIELYINGEASGNTITLSTEQNSNDKFTNLPKYDEDGVEIEYTIVETTELTDYEDPDYDMDTPGLFTVTNKHEVVPVSFEITKQWVDNQNQDGKRTSSITVNIYANGDKVDTRTLNGDVKKDTWTFTIDGLDKYKDGDEITYTIDEVQVAEYEEPVVSGDAKEGFTIINTHNPSKISVSGVKSWNHGDNEVENRPDSITVRLHAKVGDTELTDLEDEKTVTANDNWKFSFDNLDEYKDGDTIVYTVTEDAIVDYTTEIDNTDNPHVYTITNTYTPQLITISGVKKWDDASDQDGKRPGSITVILKNGDTGDEVDRQTASGDSDEWAFKFENVKKNAKGQPINYIIEEEIDDEVAQAVYTFSGGNVIEPGEDENHYIINIQNSHTPEKITYRVTKNWEDYNNADEIRPDSITVTLYKTVNGVRSKVQTFEISAANNWTYEFPDLPRYEGGVEIEYDVVEDVVAGYVADYSSDSSTNDDGKKEVNANITNTETIDINIVKIWEDSNDYDRIRPSYITVKLFANGTYVNSYRISRENNWQLLIEGLLKYVNGELVVYTIEEEAVEGYTSVIDGYTITNTHEVTKKDVVEEMPPKTGVESSGTNYLFLLLVTVIGTLGAFASRIKKVFIQA